MSFKSDYTRPLGYIPYIGGRGKTAASYYLSSVFKPYPCVPAEIFGSEAEIVFVFGVRIGYDRFVGVSLEFFYQRSASFGSTQFIPTAARRLYPRRRRTASATGVPLLILSLYVELKLTHA